MSSHFVLRSRAPVRHRRAKAGARRRQFASYETHWRKCGTHASEWARAIRVRPPLSAPDHRLGERRTEARDNTPFLKQIEFPRASGEDLYELRCC
jgi:hypothetical protein